MADVASWPFEKRLGETFRRRPQRPATRLSDVQARSIAQDAADTSAPDLRLAMTLAECQEEQGRLVWHVSSATVGSGFLVTIDDATGVVMDVKRWGVR